MRRWLTSPPSVRFREARMAGPNRVGAKLASLLSIHNGSFLRKPPCGARSWSSAAAGPGTTARNRTGSLESAPGCQRVAACSRSLVSCSYSHLEASRDAGASARESRRRQEPMAAGRASGCPARPSLLRGRPGSIAGPSPCISCISCPNLPSRDTFWISGPAGQCFRVPPRAFPRIRVRGITGVTLTRKSCCLRCSASTCCPHLVSTVTGEDRRLGCGPVTHLVRSSPSSGWTRTDRVERVLLAGSDRARARDIARPQPIRKTGPNRAPTGAARRLGLLPPTALLCACSSVPKSRVCSKLKLIVIAPGALTACVGVLTEPWGY
jgi:hypothetical protein